jgi:hypothetical protein
MPRWVFLLALVSVALGGGVESAWAAPAATETHESTLPGETLPAESAPSAEEAEEEKEADRLGALAGVLPVAQGLRPAPEAGPSLGDVPPEPPPR